MIMRFLRIPGVLIHWNCHFVDDEISSMPQRPVAANLNLLCYYVTEFSPLFSGRAMMICCPSLETKSTYDPE